MNQTLRPVRNFYRREILLDLPPGSSFIFREENNMGQPIHPPAVFRTEGFDAVYASSDVIVVGDSHTDQYVLAGAVTAFRSLTFFLVTRRATLLHSIEVRQPDILEGETPEEVVVLKGSDWRELLIRYGRLCAEKMSVKPIDARKNLTGYCTWYYYYADVTEKDFLENLEAVKVHRDSGFRAEVVQIDDGYQTFQGDWNDQDPSWPTPLAEIGKRIQDSGMTPGIWLMPFQASTASRVFREHPDWFVKNEKGEPKVTHGWSPAPDNFWLCLDTTIPAVREHLAKIFKTFWDWGFRYFKMDGLGFGLMEGKRSDPAATPVSAFRLGLQTIREAVPEAHLLGCCPPFMPCLGYVDSARISDDTRANWDTVVKCYHSILSRFWLYDRFFRCDPDVMIARQDRSAEPDGSPFSLGAARLSVLTGILTGVTLTSDHLNTIAPERLALLARGASLRMRDAMPLRWEGFQLPEEIAGTIDGKKAVALVNLGNTAKSWDFADVTLDPAREAEEVLHPLGKRKYAVTVPPRDAVLLVQD